MARKRVQWFIRGSWWRRLRKNRKYKDKLFRFLIYFALQYEGMVSAGKNSLFGRKRILLPTPEYVVFYNGTEAAPDETVFLQNFSMKLK